MFLYENTSANLMEYDLRCLSLLSEVMPSYVFAELKILELFAR